MDAGSLIRSGICISKYSELEFTKTNIGSQRLKDSDPKQFSVSLKSGFKGMTSNCRHNPLTAQELVDKLLSAGDKLVVIDFYSPGCGGCRALHPKICQIADLNQNAIFLKVNYEELGVMCTSLNTPVLPFFRFYRGAEGTLCSFSCTNATIKKFKDALEKHGTDRCSLGPAKGLEEAELLRLASNKQISLNFPPMNYEEALHNLFETKLEDFTSSIIQR
ncbi:thioredoxin-like 1-1, chloroplastic [Papaver somniferum]|uniref:thioredoxin-like 1-1, chloroplastic n=1 Tax=Papaver somniferum TaxID=3469 RepID=UPI000E6F6F3D|nr:thioredoxin-like 1-1, chloroplastic [Papaver somniferum]